MSRKVYILNLDGIPQYVTTDYSRIEASCQEWFDRHYDNWAVQRAYHAWLEDKTEYPNTDDGEEQAWKNYVAYCCTDGFWGDYEWCESELI
mgnify:CR=1 FL=1